MEHPSINNENIVAMEDLWSQEELAREISSFLSIEDLLSMEKTCLYFQEQLSATDSVGIWQQVEDTIMKGMDSRPESVDNAKTHALLFHKAETFANEVADLAANGEQLSEMGQDVAYEFFDIDELKDDQEPFCKSGFEIFVRITNEHSRRLLFQGFVLKFNVATNIAPITYHTLQLLIDDNDFCNGAEFGQLVESIDFDDMDYKGSQAYVQALNATIIAAHKDLPCRLIRSTAGGPASGNRRGIQRRGTHKSFFPTQSQSMNEEFLLKGAPHKLCCEFGVTAGPDGEGSIYFGPTLNLSFNQVIDWDSINRQIMELLPHRAQENSIVFHVEF